MSEAKRKVRMNFKEGGICQSGLSRRFHEVRVELDRQGWCNVLLLLQIHCPPFAPCSGPLDMTFTDDSYAFSYDFASLWVPFGGVAGQSAQGNSKSHPTGVCRPEVPVR